MGRINVLDSRTANAIKAGEVIDRPVSVVKELIDNAVDSGASRIKVEFAGGGIKLIRVSDNGCGMDREDAQKAFLIHATSKLKTIEDIYDLSTLGFRGEALASIASCADVTLTTARTDDGAGTRVTYVDGTLKDVCDAPSGTGTTVDVRGLFKNFPARYKFLKKDSTEGMYITGLVEKLAIINPHISIKLIKDGAVLFTTPGSGSLKDAIYAVYGKDTAANLVPVDFELEGLKIKGLTGLPRYTRGNRGLQCIYVNDRLVKSKSITAAIDEAYKNSVMKNKYPVCFLMIYVNPGQVDVNVHPQKAEVKFASDQDVFRLVLHGIRNAITDNGTAGDGFTGITTPIRDDKSSADEESSVEYTGTQLKYNISAGGKLSSGLSGEEPKARTASQAASHKLGGSQPQGSVQSANKLLEILSGFSPDSKALHKDKDGNTSDADDLPSEELNAGEELDQDTYIKPEDMSSPKEDDDITRLAGARFTGILFDTFIIMQTEDTCFFVDQHAAHERVLYEEFMVRKAPGKEIVKEQVLIPAIIKVSASDYSFIEDTMEKFEENGFELDMLGDREIAIRAVPMGSVDKAASMFSEILTDLKREVPSKSEIWYRLIQTTACKAAIRAGDVITKEQALSLIEKMTRLEDPYHCAHGRPTFFVVSKKDFEKNFKRIV